MIRKKGSEEEKEYLRTNKWKFKKKNLSILSYQY